MGGRAAMSTGTETLLTCWDCRSRFEPLMVDRRGRLVSGYALLQRHRDECPDSRPRAGERHPDRG